MNWPAIIGNHELKITGRPTEEWPDEPHSAEYVSEVKSMTFLIEAWEANSRATGFDLSVTTKSDRTLPYGDERIFIGTYDSIEDVEHAMTFIGGLNG